MLKYTLPLFLLLAACSGEATTEDNTKSSDPSNAEEAPKVEVVELTLDTENSTADWTRILNQKATKKKMKLFGADVDVEMGPVTIDMSGNVVLTSGSLSTVDGEFKEGMVTFDMATFKFAKEKGQGLFDTKEYPNSTLEFLSFSKGEEGELIAHSRLTIQDHSEEMDIVLTEGASPNTRLEGEFTFNTLDFPLREQVDAEAVNKDEVTVVLGLIFVSHVG